MRTISVPEDFVILVADRNRHVLDLLKRELALDGYTIKIAKDDREIMEILETPHRRTCWFWTWRYPMEED